MTGNENLQAGQVWASSNIVYEILEVDKAMVRTRCIKPFRGLEYKLGEERDWERQSFEGWVEGCGARLADSEGRPIYTAKEGIKEQIETILKRAKETK